MFCPLRVSLFWATAVFLLSLFDVNRLASPELPEHWVSLLLHRLSRLGTVHI